MVETSRRLGVFFSWNVPLARRAAGMSASDAFLAPSMVIDPWSRFPPLITNLSKDFPNEWFSNFYKIASKVNCGQGGVQGDGGADGDEQLSSR